ncbi:MAG: tetratricopeptide repeat protein [Gammaproteobacteria bacterium]|nr:MAG: tetratricopeptide repeat protein [Gammaproteobacteria bacterium]
MASLFEELKRRNVLRVVVLYIVVGWLLIQVADVLFPAMELPNWTIRLVFAMLLIGFPAAIIFSWAFEITPEGVKREKDVDRSKSVTHHTGRKLDYITIGVVIAAVALAFADRLTREPQVVAESVVQAETAQPVETSSGRPESSETSIAVLPFVNMSDDASNEYFSDGISEELLNLLVRVEGLRVPSRTSSFAFKGTNTDLPTIAKKLAVDHVLEGSVRKAGNRVRITAQLIDVSDDRHLWSETYDRDLEDIFAVQDEIATAIVEALKGVLGMAQAAPVEHRPPTDNIEAYQLYLRARHIWAKRGAENLKTSLDYFEQAVELDPGFARALSGMASAYMLIPVYQGGDTADYWPLARETAERALEKDPDIGEAHAVIAAAHENASEWRDAEEAFRRAVAADPYDVTAAQWYAEFLYNVGRNGEAVKWLRKAYELDPLSPIVNASLAFALIGVDGFEEARKHGEIALELGIADSANAQLFFALLHLSQGRYTEALEVFEEAVARGRESLAMDVLALRGVIDPTQRARAIEALAAEKPDALRDGLNPPIYYVLLDMPGEALDYLERAAAMEQVWWPPYWWKPAVDVRRDPRFVPIIEEAGLVDYWREYGWPESCRETNGQVTCE